MRELEYQLRIAFAQADYPCSLHAGPLFLHKEFEYLLSIKYPEKKSWKPWEILKQLDKWEDGIGCPTFNGLRHWVKNRFVVDLQGRNSRKVSHMGEVLSEKVPVIAVIYLFPDYPLDAGRPYLGLDHMNRLYPQSLKETCLKHAVVIVGQYIVRGRDHFSLEPGTYWLYQDSIQPGTTSIPAGLFGNFIGILHPRVALEGYFGKSRIPNVMLSEREAARQKDDIDTSLTEKLLDIADLREYWEN